MYDPLGFAMDEPHRPGGGGRSSGVDFAVLAERLEGVTDRLEGMATRFEEDLDRHGGILTDHESRLRHLERYAESEPHLDHERRLRVLEFRPPFTELYIDRVDDRIRRLESRWIQISVIGVILYVLASLYFPELPHIPHVGP